MADSNKSSTKSSTKSSAKVGSRRRSGPARSQWTSKSVLKWSIRALVVIIVGGALGVGAGVLAVNRLEPGRPNSVDSLAVMLDSLSSGRIQGTSSGRTDSSTAGDGSHDASQSAAPDTARATVPSVVGFEEGDARNAILAAGLQVGEVTFSLSGKPAGTVLSTSPNGGTPVAPGFAVSLVLSDGRGTVDTLSLAPPYQSEF